MQGIKLDIVQIAKKCSGFYIISFFQRYQEHCCVYRIKRSVAVYYQGAQDICQINLNIHLLKIASAFWSDIRNINCYGFCEFSSFQRYQEHCSYIVRNKKIGDHLFISLYSQIIYHYMKACPTSMRKTN
jgi:hypothetical protein